MPPFVNLYPNNGKRSKRVENPDNVKGKKEKQLKAIWGYLSPRIEYLKDIPKKFLIKVFLQYLIQKNLKKNLIKIQRIH